MANEIRSTNSFLNDQVKYSMGSNYAKIARLSDKVTSGKNARNYADLVGSTSIEGYVSNKEVKQSLDSKILNNTNLVHKLSEIDRVERSMLDVVTDSLRLCQKARDPGVAGAVDIVGLTQNQLRKIELLLNSSFQGQKLFAGGKTDVAETVNDLTSNSNIVVGVITPNYYNGDDYILKYAISRDRVLEYGVNANNPIFQNFIAAHNYLINGDTDNALNLLQQAKVDLGTLIIDNGSNSLAVEEQIETDKNSASALFEAIVNTEDTDILQAMTEMANLETQLKASFQLTTKISELSLTNYLR